MTGRGERTARKHTLEVAAYELPVPTESPAGASISRNRFPAARLPARTVTTTGAALLSLALHALLIASLSWGAGRAPTPTQPPRDSGAPGENDSHAGQLTMELLPLEDTDAFGVDAAPIASAPMLTPIKVDEVHPENVPDLTDSDDRHSASGAVDSAEFSALYGRYVGQINARIERAWLKPRTPLEAGSFSCRVRIEQDTAGSVREITLESCSGDSSWQLSLVHAIQSASPLPAPPDPKVFRRVLRAQFRAEPLSAGAPEDGYEPAGSP